MREFPSPSHASSRRSGCLLLVVLPLLALALTCATTAATALWAARQTDRHGPWVARGIELALDWPPGTVQLGHVALDEDLRLHLAHLEVTPPMQVAPRVSLQRAETALPSPRRLWEEQTLALGEVVVEGLRIDARVQRPAPPLVPPDQPPLSLAADEVVIRGATYTAPDDPPMKEVRIEGIEGRFHRVRWTPRVRRIQGSGTAQVQDMVLGAIELHDVALPVVELTGTSMLFEGAKFGYGRTDGFAMGRIDRLDNKPAVDMQVQIRGDRVETAIQTAIGSASPVLGTLSASVHLKAGGDLPRGAAHFDGWMHLSDAYLYVGPDLGALPKILLDIAPWFDRRGEGWVHIGNLRGEARFGRGWVELRRLERPSDRHRALQAWGTLREQEVDLYVRAVPKRRPDDRPGLGVWVGGQLNNLRVRLARRDELRKAPRTFGL